MPVKSSCSYPSGMLPGSRGCHFGMKKLQRILMSEVLPLLVMCMFPDIQMPVVASITVNR